MRILFLVLILLTPNLHAQSTETQQDINRSCLQYSVHLLEQLKRDVLGDINDADSNAILELSNQSCKKYMTGQAQTQPAKQTLAEEKVAKTGNKDGKVETAEEKTEDKDWFTEYVLHGDPHSKKGVKRLKRRKQ